MSVINTNVLSLVTQNNLKSSQSSLESAIERLSSGKRINSAKDDAAGQAIANRFTANINGLTQASRNANDGISLAQTTEGALDQVNDNLQRIRELTVQAQNGSNSSSDLKSIQDEINQRLAEIDRTSQQTDFNGVKVLSSSAKALSIQVGAHDGETISIGLQEISSKTLGLNGFNVDGTGTANTAATKSDLTLAGFTAGATDAQGTTAYSKTTAGATTNNAAATRADVFGKTVTGSTVTSNSITYTKQADGTFSDSQSGLASTGLTPTGGSQTAATVTIGGKSTDVLIDSSGNLTSASDNKALFLDATGNLTETNANGDPGASLSNLEASMTTAAGGSGAAGTGGTIVTSSNGVTDTFTANTTSNNFDLSESLTSAALQTRTAANSAVVDMDGSAATTTDSFTIAANGSVTTGSPASAVYVDAGASGALDTNSTTTAASTTATYYVHSNGNVTDASANTVYDDSANAGQFTLNAKSGNTATASPLAALDAALSKVDDLRSALGAVQNRFDSVISNLGTTVTNLTASRSRIEDADYATEVSNMSRAQILQQAGTSVLAQANQSTQGVLKLLG